MITNVASFPRPLPAKRAFINPLTPLVLAWILSFSVSAQVRVGDTAPPFTLADQFGRQTKLHFPQNTFILLVFADRRGSSAAQKWLQALAGFPNNSRTVSVACTGWVPSLLKPFIRRAFEQHQPILIDWNDTVANQYGYPGTGCRLVVISPSGTIVTLDEGDCSPTRVATLSRLLH